LKFATKLIVLFSGIFVISSVSLAYFVYISNLTILEREIKEQLEGQAFHTMDKIDRMMYERYSDVQYLANDPVMKSRSHTPKQIEEKLRSSLRESRFYGSLSFFTMNRVRVADTSGKLVGKQRDFVEYWRDIAAGKEFVLNLHRSITLNMVVMHFVQVIKDGEGMPLGVVVSRMPVEILYDITGKTTSVAGGERTRRTLDMDLVDGKGMVLYSNYHEGILADISPFWGLVEPSLTSGKRMGSVRGSYKGEERIFVFARESGYASFEGNGWTLIMSIPTKDAFADAVEMRNKVLGISLGLGILSLLGIFFFSRSVSGPLLSLSNAATEIGKGNLDTKVEVSSRDEIGQMAHAFNTMAERLREYVAGQRRSEETLRKSEMQNRALINAIPDMIFRVSKEGTFLEYKAARHFSSYVPPTEFLGARVQDIMPAEVGQKALHHIEYAIQTGELQTLEYSLQFGHELRQYECRIVSISQDDALAIIRDITEHRQLEEQLRQAQKMEAIGTLTGGVAHEFNNILNVVLGYGELLQGNLDKENRLRGYVDTIVASGERAAKLTRGLLAYSRRQMTHMEAVDVNEVVRAMEGLLSSFIAKNIRLTIEISDRELTTMADRAQIEQVLMNLASNAIDAMQGGGVLTISTQTAAYREEVHGPPPSMKPDAYALISVKDNGVGIDKDTQGKVFEPFFTTKEVGKGTGLGLSMVYGMVKRHDGHITLESEPGRGSIFNVYLPLAEAGKAEKEPLPSSLKPESGAGTVLVAEDDRAVQDLIKLGLEKHGYGVILANDGTDAVEKFTQYKEEISLLLFDAAMPGKSGTEAYEEIRKTHSHIKVLFMSGHMAADTYARAILDKGLPFLSKPFTLNELIYKIHETLGGSSH
jgi:signal transduction histidine kinase/ActR/RegA family two-component response regulator